MLSKSEIQGNLSKLSFCKTLPLGENWKSKSMRMIPEELVKSKPEVFENRVVFEVLWGNSWQLWLERDKKGLFMIEEDWNEFVDDNSLDPNDTLSFRHQDTMFFKVRIFKKDEKEIIDVPLETEPETKLIHLKFPNSHQEKTTTASVSANEGTNARASQGCVHVEKPERFLLFPENPYFVKTITKRNTTLYVSRMAIQKYGLKFGPAKSTINYILPDGKEERAIVRIYSGSPCFSGWSSLCRRYNLNVGDTVVCELERSCGLVSALRVHFVN